MNQIVETKKDFSFFDETIETARTLKKKKPQRLLFCYFHHLSSRNELGFLCVLLSSGSCVVSCLYTLISWRVKRPYGFGTKNQLNQNAALAKIIINNKKKQKTKKQKTYTHTYFIIIFSFLLLHCRMEIFFFSVGQPKGEKEKVPCATKETCYAHFLYTSPSSPFSISDS